MEEKDLSVNTEHEVSPSGIAHGFDTGYAIAYGVDEAIMIKNFQHFIIANANRGHNFREGRYWTYDRLEDFPGHFPYWTIKQVRRILASLIEQGVIIKGEFNKTWSDRTKWFAFKNQDKFIKNIKPPKTPLPVNPDLPKQENVSCPNGKLADDQLGNCNIDDTTTITSSVFSPSLKVPPEPVVAKATEVEKADFPKCKRVRTPSEFSPQVEEIADKMLKSLVAHKPNYASPRNLSKFLTNVDYLLRLDNRDPQLVMDVFNWALSDSFWCDKMENSLELIPAQMSDKMHAPQVVIPQQRSHMPNEHEMMVFHTMAEQAVSSKMYKGIGEKAGVMMIMLSARELGIPPMQALNGGINIIQGKVEISARMMSALIRKAGHHLKVQECTAQHCILVGKRGDTGETQSASFSVAEAQLAGLVKQGGGWTKWPKDMCFARALSRLARQLFSDVIGIGYVEGEICQTSQEKPLESETIISPEFTENEQVEKENEEEYIQKFLNLFDKEDKYHAMEYLKAVQKHFDWSKIETIKELIKDEKRLFVKFNAWKNKITKPEAKDE